MHWLVQIDGDDGKTWALMEQNAGPESAYEAKDWGLFVPFWWVRISCLLHGYGWPKVKR